MNNEQTIREIHLCLYYKEQGESRAEIARITGLSAALVKTRLAQVKSALLMNLLPHRDLEKEYPLEAAQLREDEVETQIEADRTTEANKVARELVRSEYVGRSLLDAFKQIVAPVGKNLAKAKIRKNGDIVTVVVSDAHVGKKSAHFKSQDALDCITNMIQTGITEAQDREANELVIALLGDILDGYGIYRTQTSEVELTATEQFIETLQCIGNCLEAARNGFDGKITVVGVSGNHGRISTPEVASWENFERLMYDTLAIWFRDTDIEFIVPERESFYALHRNVFYFHGHEISGGGTLDGITQRCRNWLTQLPHSWNVSVCGHFHRIMATQYPKNKWHLTNGTASREDMFIQRLGSAHTNKWWMFIQDSDENLTEMIPVDLYDEPTF